MSSDRLTEDVLKASIEMTQHGMHLRSDVAHWALIELAEYRERDAEMDRIMPTTDDEIMAAFALAQERHEKYGTAMPTSQERNDLIAERDTLRADIERKDRQIVELTADVARLKNLAFEEAEKRWCGLMFARYQGDEAGVAAVFDAWEVVIRERDGLRAGIRDTIDATRGSDASPAVIRAMLEFHLALTPPPARAGDSPTAIDPETPDSLSEVSDAK